MLVNKHDSASARELDSTFVVIVKKAVNDGIVQCGAVVLVPDGLMVVADLVLLVGVVVMVSTVMVLVVIVAVKRLLEPNHTQE